MIPTTGFDNVVRSQDIDFPEESAPLNRLIDKGFSGEMDNKIGTCYQLVHDRGISNIALDEPKFRALLVFGETFWDRRITKFVDDNELATSWVLQETRR